MSVHVEKLLEGNGDWRVVGVHLHDVGHHVPPALRDGVHVSGVLRVAVAGTFLVGKEYVGVAVPVDAVVADTLFLDHLFQFGPNGGVPFGVLVLEAWLEEHLKCKSGHKLVESLELRV